MFVYRVLALVAGLLAVLALLTIVEISCRIVEGAPDDPTPWLDLAPGTLDEAELEFQRERERVHRSDPALFWRGRPNVDIVFRGVRVRTNSLGL